MGHRLNYNPIPTVVTLFYFTYVSKPMKRILKEKKNV